MESIEQRTFDYDELVQEDYVDGRVYTDPEIFEEEIEKIFHRWWVYVGHTSEIPEPGDYRLTKIGRQPIIMARDEDYEIHLLMNRCRHRGNSVCQYERGNSSFFRCWFHGWTYNNKGDLVGVPYPSAYDESFRKEDYGLTKVPRVGIYRGFIFASLSPEGISLDEHLEPAKKMIDVFVDLSPEGEIEVRSGCHKGKYKGNWKFVGMDGYHSEFVHRSLAKRDAKRPGKKEVDKEIASATKKEEVFETTKVAQLNPDDSGNFTRDLGNGHARLDFSARLSQSEQLLAPFKEHAWGRSYLEAMEKRHGKKRAHDLISLRTPHVGIWPNLQIIDFHVRVIQPVSVDETEVLMFPVLLKGVPQELNADRLRKHEWFYGPAGFGSPDDYEIFERNQLGLNAQVEPKVLLSRGLSRERVDADDSIVGYFSDETPQRGQLKQWKKVMTS